MYVTADHALCLIDQAVAIGHDAGSLRSAIREAFASNAPVEHIATRARTSIHDVLAVVNEMYAGRADH
ncbi:hypothetical protein [Catellatospora paridis]|uniref:hypothetical protein n=1 Tax=Catellatospora paridis TaxID=1617086 RepID=UPI0012D39E77|nr:hypothetical protein [Catellatospora paridis]